MASVYFKTSSAKYKVTQEVQIVNGNIKANLADLNIMNIYVDGEKLENKQVPTGNYEIDEQSNCTANGVEDNNITFEYKAGKIGVYGVSQSKTKCDIYLNKIPSPTDAITDKVIADEIQPNFSHTSCLNGTTNSTHDGENCDEETNGVYSETTSLGTTYYFRGTVNNNWVKFGKMNETKEIWCGYARETANSPNAWYSSQSECSNSSSNNINCTLLYSSKLDEDIWWRIIRINEDGTIRLIYAGSGTKDEVASPDKVNGVGGYWISNSYIGINNTGYNLISNQNAYVGYMYGTPGSQSYEEEHGFNLIDEGQQEKLNSSNAKTEIDKWYEINLADEGSMLSGSTGFCGDRSLGTYTGPNGNFTNLGYGKEKTYYKAYDRLDVNYEPSYECPNPSLDLYTTKSDPGKGNGALTYPIGLITADEVVYAGGKNYYNRGYWLYTGKYYFTLSPRRIEVGTYVYSINDVGGTLVGAYTSDKYGLRPVVNLKPEYFKTQDANGNVLDGTIEKPYIASAE